MRWGLVDQIEQIDVGRSAVGIRTWDPDLPLFLDHFPDFPVVPGVLLLESMAQVAGKLIGYTVRKERGDWPFPILSLMEKVKFRKFVRPGERTELRVELVALRDESALIKGRVFVEGRWRARAEQFFVFNAVPFADEAERAKVEQCEREALTSLWPDYPGDF